MLRFPTVQLFDHPLSLPTAATDVSLLCSLVTADDDGRELALRLSECGPGVLIFVLAQHWQLTRRRVEDWSELCHWIRRSLFLTTMDSMDFQHWKSGHRSVNRILRTWNENRSLETLARCVKIAAGISWRQSRELLSAMVHSDLEFGRWNGKHNRPVRLKKRTPGESVLTINCLNIMWRLCGRWQQARQLCESGLQGAKLEAMKQLAYGASHEINNPLANIATRAQSLMADESSPTRRQRLAVIYTQAMRAHEMISDMMLFAHSPASHWESVEIQSLLQGIIDKTKQELSGNDISLVIRRYPNVPICDLDSRQIREAIQAIVQNALIAIGRRGEIRIQIWRYDELRIAIAIADNGPGVPQELAEQIFDPFFSGREAGRGLGFGLCKAWRIFQIHGGELKLDKTYVNGARFVMTLPIRQDAITASDQELDSTRAA